MVLKIAADINLGLLVTEGQVQCVALQEKV